MIIKVVVTQQDIDRGKRASSLNCPVAIAASRATNKTVAVGNYSASTRYEEMNTRWELPRSAERFIKKFDDFQSVKPFTFFLKEGF